MLSASIRDRGSCSMPARILLCRSNPISPDPRVEKEARVLVDAGYPVTVLSWDRSGALPANEQKNGYCILRLPIKARFGSGLMNFPHLFRWQIGLFTWLIRHRQAYDLIHACDFDTILPALACKKAWRKKVVYDIFDFYADHLRATPALAKKLIRAVDLRAIGAADGLILVDDARVSQIQGSRPRRVQVIYNSPVDVLPEMSRIEIGENKGSFRLAYIGLLQVERGLMQMLEVLRLHPDWELDLAGFGGDEEMILAAARKLPNVRWHGRIPYASALKLSYQADVLFATYDPAIPNHRYSSANKLFEAMMLGKPVVVARNTNMDRLVEDASCGIVVEYSDLAALEDALSRLQCDPPFRRRLGENARKAYEQVYSWNHMQGRLLQLYQEVLH